MMSLAIWYVFTEYLEVAVASEPVTFTTLWLLRFHQDTSILSTIRLIVQFYRRGLASKFAMFVMMTGLFFTLAFSTIAGSMTGYATSNQPYIRAKDEAMIPLKDVRPVAYVINDGHRVTGHNDNYLVPWTNSKQGIIDYDLEMVLTHCLRHRFLHVQLLWREVGRRLGP